MQGCVKKIKNWNQKKNDYQLIFSFKIDCQRLQIYQKNEEAHISGLAGDDATLHKGINIVVMHK